jgi:FMN phosphatase YigB (HAD superfamily)
MPDTRQPFTDPDPIDDTDGPGAELDASRERHEGLQRRARIADRRTLIARSGLFDADWYQRHHAPAAHSDLPPLDHYLSRGVAAGAAPGPLFDPDAYLRRVWHLVPGHDDPLSHYLQHGLAEGRPSISRVDAPPAGLRNGPVEPLVSQQPPSHRLTLAVVVHVFYADLFGEICDALAMIPYRFTLLVTTDDPDKADAIRDGFAARSLDAVLVVRVGPNRGRNFGPFLLQYRKIVSEHELVLHLHTKKSLYTGSELAGWRQGLLRTLLPAMPVVSGLIARFVSDPTLGVISAAPGEAVRYWGYNWLSNRHLAQPLFARLGLRSRVPSGMFDYPIGGMFWARTTAIAKLLEHDWQAADFPEECGQTDGTIMHAIERIILLMAAEAGYGFAELDYEHGLCRPGWSSRNLDQYRLASHAGLLDTIDRVDTVSFDLFDTLLTRICLAPDAVHRFIGWAAARRYPGANDFPARRRAAEDALRREQHGGDVGLDEIQARFARDAGSGWSAEAIAFVAEQEVALDARTLRPRALMVEALDVARARGRRILVTSDSYLPRRAFDAMLDRFGLRARIDETYLSSERRARKDDGALWRLVAAAEPGTLLHVGDNEQSDIQATADRGIRHFHVLGPATLFALRGLDPGADADGTRPLGDDILLGPVAARLFDSPYLDTDVLPAPVLLSRPEEAGAVMFGPLLFAFIAWLARHPAVAQLDRLFFASREGWFLKRLYDAVRAASGRTDLPPSSYFHASRRAVLSALQGGGLDPDPVLRGAGFRGTLGDFLLARLGIAPDPSLRHMQATIALPRDAELVRCAMEMMEPAITAHGQTALEAFKAYADASGMTAPGRHGFVDVGYSGTMQAAIQRMLGRPLIGLYMGVSQDAAQVRAGGGYAFGAFVEGDVGGFTGGYGLMLEAVLTAPHGQVIGYDIATSPPSPLFRHDGVSQRTFAVLERLYDGAEEYALDLLRCYGPDLLDLPFRAEAATAMLQAVRDGRLRLSPDLMAALSVEDDFCGSGEIPVFSQLVPDASGPPPARP